MTILEALSKILEKAHQAPEKAAALIKYLTYFGYLASDKDFTIEEILRAVKQFQEQFGLSEQGIGPKTIGAMEWPRCAVKENVMEFARQTPKWGLKEISYYIKKRDSDISPQEWDAAIGLAFAYWSEVTPLKFYQVDSPSQANIVLDVGSGRADDFDGPGGTLAWCQLPPTSNYQGQLLCKFDAGETWIVNKGLRGIYLVNVACHELGHALGLTHSSKSSALMAPYYSPQVAKPQTVDDIPRVQVLYGKPVIVTPPPTDPPVPGKNKIIVEVEFTGEVHKVQVPGYRVSKQD